jgi:hypothetical protein
MREVLLLCLLGVCSLGCSDDDGVSWKDGTNPCSDEYLDSPDVVAEIKQEITANRYSTEEDALSREAEARIHEINGVLWRARRLRCMAWLIRDN